MLSLFVLSIGVNIFFVSYYYYITRKAPLELTQLSVTRNCNTAQYTKWMQNIPAVNGSSPEDVKKFAAASVCFTDYDTGRPIDIDSLKPNMSDNPILPAHP